MTMAIYVKGHFKFHCHFFPFENNIFSFENIGGYL
jgi:hypothetical protein